MDNELILNIKKIHTTELGVVRIKKNLSLGEEDAVEFCKHVILSPDTVITRSGKNWYAVYGDIKITINAYSYTIITAHRI